MMINDPSPKSPQGLSRRGLMAGAAGAIALASLTSSPVEAHAADVEPIGQADYDVMFGALNEQLRPEHNESGSWAWAWGRVLLSYLPMYLAYRDPKYLDQFVVDADRLLAARDSERGVCDYRGVSLPWWRVGNGYATGSVTLSVGSGTVEFRIGRWGGADRGAGTIDIAAGSTSDCFTLTVTDVTGTRVNRYVDVSLDPLDGDYVVDRMWNAAQSANGTAVDHRAGHAAGDSLPLGTHRFLSEWYGDAVNTGVLTTPLAWFARVVRDNAELDAEYGEVADRYAAAALAAVECHEPDWREGPGGTGWYIDAAKSPMLAAGSDAPQNKNLSVALTWLHLSRVSSDPRTRAHARRRACRILRYFRDDLTLVDDAYVWTYWSTDGTGYRGWTQTDGVSERIPVWPGYRVTEDTSHAMLDIFAVLEAHKERCVFTDLDLQRFANTFADNIMTTDSAGNPATTKDVAGAGGVGQHDQAVGVWAELAAWRPEISGFLNQLFRSKAYPPKAGYYPLSTAFVAAHNASR